MIAGAEGIVRLKSFNQFPGLVHGFSTRSLGNMKAGLDDREEVMENRKKLARTAGLDLNRLVEGEQVHGNEITVVGKENFGERIPAADGLLTQAQEVFLLIKTADCLPVLFYHPVRGVAGAVHAGWKGIAAGIGRKTVRLMRTRFDCRPEDLWVGVGPAVGSCCYSVSQERAARFKGFGEGVVKKREGKKHLDLKRAFSQDLIKAGVRSDRIEISPLCSSCREEDFFSFRREGKALGGEMAAVIGRKKEK